MTRQAGRRALGQVVDWPIMDTRIEPTTTILERIGAHGIASVSYTVHGRSERFLTYRHIKELEVVT